jgi:hypothetical protein
MLQKWRNLIKNAVFVEKNGRVCAEMCAEKAKKCGWKVADEAGISESNGRCFASETIGASK